MTNPWFRFYSETLNDRKIERIGRNTQEPKAVIIGVWAVVLALANDSPQRGVLLLTDDIPVTIDEDLTAELEMDAERVSLIIHQFVRLGLVQEDESGVLSVAKWDNRQFQSDSSQKRVDEYRKRRQGIGMPAAPAYNTKEIIARDGGKCVYCGSTKNLCVDHILPIDQGGTDDERNLCAACKKCNSGKAGRTPEEAKYTIENDGVTQRYRDYLQSVTFCNGYSNAPDTDTDTETDTEHNTATRAGKPPPVPPPKKRKTQHEKPPSQAKAESQAMFSALALACRINTTTLTQKQRDALNQSEKRLRQAGATPADMPRFSEWWKAHDWRGQKGDAPRPDQVREVWGQYAAWRDGEDKPAVAATSKPVRVYQ